MANETAREANDRRAREQGFKDYKDYMDQNVPRFQSLGLRMSPNEPRSKSDSLDLQKIMDTALAGVRGVGSGATAGLLKYPVAAGMTGINRLTGGKGTFSDALDTLNEQEATDFKDNPTATRVGNVAGALAGAKGVGRGAKFLLDKFGKPVAEEPPPNAPNPAWKDAFDEAAKKNRGDLSRMKMGQDEVETAPAELEPLPKDWTPGKSMNERMAEAKKDAFRPNEVNVGKSYADRTNAMRELFDGKDGGAYRQALRRNDMETLDKIAQKYGFKDATDLQNAARQPLEEFGKQGQVVPKRPIATAKQMDLGLDSPNEGVSPSWMEDEIAAARIKKGLPR